MCYDCEAKLDVNNKLTLVFDDGVVYCEDCLKKKKKSHVPELQKRKEEHKTLDYQRNKMGNCFVCNQPVVKGGEVCALMNNSQSFLTINL